MAVTLTDFKQVCLDIAKEAGEVFDVVDERGMDGVLDIANARRMMRVAAMAEELQAFVFVQNTLRMRALGVDPLKVPGYREGVRRFLGVDVVDGGAA